ncbi:undecaprenyl/decaprenyl-phosphate alpha-N-acetylglucosaminyl 1-phosphate transferase (plasmid) [Sulfitobacter sp. W027]|uniref:glycosyltransferase family 4 protein n=1 Tax=Sulfitobacter sp. W027 TaxID=2867025 RepID=UPI0021A6FCA3|nr:MraY family glycosyltransferase [Sulfitobacter sp. W027]UWR35710.1 undecaprenyl/decaprenyl-phosphate alpha-N-acetylglucosaminyl 1-phosphate transferase [Sulfitobacter sp. W027]
MFEIWIYLATFSISLLISLSFIAWPTLLMSREHMERDLAAPQATHTRPTPRVGGVGIVLALALGVFLYLGQLGSDLVIALAAGAVVFLVGLLEDIQRNVSPRTRLLAAFLSAALAIGVTGVVVPDLGLFPGSLAHLVVPAIAITLLWSAGTCHALNLIDGLNGLSALYSISAALGFFLIAGYTGDVDVQIVSGLLIAAVLGFFVLNWPMGRIFLGDAGAYGIGHILAWLGIVLVARNPSVTGVAVLLLLFWPVCDTLFSIIRRRLTKRATDQPDRLHFHHLAVRALPLLSRRNRRTQFDNSVATILLVPFFCVPMATGVLLWNHPIAAAVALATYIALFMGTYVASMKFFRSRRFRQPLRLVSPSLNRKIPERQISAFSGTYACDGANFDVQIYRDHSAVRWTLQASAAGTGILVLKGKFATDADAYGHFLQSEKLLKAA